MSNPTYPKRKNSRSGSLGQFLRSRERMIHVSKDFMRNPLALIAEQNMQVFDGPQFVALPGVTYRRECPKRGTREGEK